MTKKKRENHVLRDTAIGAAIIGAGVLAAKALSNEETREKIGETLSNLNDTKDEVVKKLTEEFENLRSEIQESKSSKDLQNEVGSIAAILRQIKESNEEDVNTLVEQLKSSVEKLKRDFVEMQKA